MRIEHLLQEVRILGTYEVDAIKDNQTIRVYHGTSNMEMLVVAATKGLTGGARVSRRYSYENNNNPRGLFVTPDFRTAKGFGQYVLEFHTKVADLEAPVWPGGSWTPHGGLSSYWSDEDERRLAALAQRERLTQSEKEYIRNSDRPDVAYWLLNVGERQALFTGNLNSNSIRAIWAPKDPSVDSKFQSLIRMKPRDFIKIAQSVAGVGELTKDAQRKLFSPRDTPTFEEYVSVLERKYRLDRREIIDILKKSPESVRQHFWSDEQWAAAIAP